MQATAKTVPATKTATWAGYILTTLIVLFMLMDATMHIAKPSYVVASFIKLGFPVSLSLTIAIVALLGTVLYAIPRTSILGAILLTGYLGGATAIQVRIDGSYWFSIVFGILVWLALYLRDEKLRELLPLRS